MATFNGSDLGPAVVTRTSPNPVALQIISYPGINGTGVNRGGSRGGRTEGTAVFYADTPTDLDSAVDTFLQYALNATAGTLVDTKGHSWSNCILVEFSPLGEIEFAPGFGWVQEYHFEFYHPA